jgi:hypothetical protein
MTVVHLVRIVSEAEVAGQAAAVAAEIVAAVATAVVLESVYYVRVDDDKRLVHDVYYERYTTVCYDRIVS